MPNKPPADATPTPDSPAPVVVRRISNPRPKKAPAKPAPDQAPATDEPVAAAPLSAPAPPPEAPPAEEATTHLEAQPATGDDWPEPEAPNTPGQETNKRKRRRRKGKGQGQQQANAQPQDGPASEEIFSLGEANPPPVPVADAPKPQRPPVHPPRPAPPRPKIDPETLATKAWKIYLAEVSEEGVALISDQDARELARRCFRLAEIFIEEQSRRLQGA